jgi:Family of unknown function (DUF6169)
VYQIDFNPDPDLFETGLVFSAGVAELIIKVRQNAGNKLPASDKLIAPTIAAIVADFFRVHSESVVLYICDSSDGRQAARWRKFNDWFAYFNQDEFVKHDLSVFDENDGITYYNAIIFRVLNPYRQEIITAFNNILSSYNEPK